MNLEQYQSTGRRSIYKGIPIDKLKDVQTHFRNNLRGIRYIFRGPRYDSMRASTRKKDAHSFDIYFKECR
jgi:hypothetical protein